MTHKFGKNLNLQKVSENFQFSKFKSFATSSPVFWLLVPITFYMVFNYSVSNGEEPLQVFFMTLI